MSEEEKTSRAVENFLKAVYVLQQQADREFKLTDTGEAGRVSTNALAEALMISAPSVTDMARRMVDANLVDYQKYYGVRLTPDGSAVALRVIRRHRLIETYLAEELGYDLHEVHDEAEELEHVVSDRFIDAIAMKLGQPTVDPHGDPIPSKEGVIVRADTVPLTELALEVPGIISRFAAESSEMMQYMMSRNFRLGAEVKVLEREPFQGPLTVQVNGDRSVIGYKVAACILVELTDA
jgi:DtxR family Mn-dependent transcriptional regulator